MTAPATPLTFFDLMDRHPWQLMDGETNRWTLGKQGLETPIEALIGPNPESFPHYHCFERPNNENIHLLIWPEGGLLSYHRHNGQFLHTLATKVTYRQLVAGLNLVPLIDLRNLLEPMVEAFETAPEQES